MSFQEIKKIKVTGSAAESVLKSRKTRKRTKIGGAMPSFSHAPVEAPFTLKPVEIAPPPAPPAPVLPPPPSVVVDTLKQKGGADKSVKVILAPSKKKASKVILAPPKATTAAIVHKSKGKTMRVGRRIRMNVDGLSKKLNRAKTIKKESEKMPIEKIKADLVSVGLIKSDSKAPEGILRHMYSDFQMLKQKAL